MNPAEFLLDLATGQVNDISVPEVLSSPQKTAEYERVVIKVRSLYLLLPSHKLSPLSRKSLSTWFSTFVFC